MNIWLNLALIMALITELNSPPTTTWRTTAAAHDGLWYLVKAVRVVESVLLVIIVVVAVAVAVVDRVGSE